MKNKMMTAAEIAEMERTYGVRVRLGRSKVAYTLRAAVDAIHAAGAFPVVNGLRADLHDDGCHNTHTDHVGFGSSCNCKGGR